MSTRQPLRGYNHNVRHLDMVFHIQTEDSGVKAPHIFTHCFHEGTIVATKKRDYPADATEDVVRSVMKEQHKELMRELKHGAFDEKIRRYFGAQAAAITVEGADAAAAAAVAEVKKAAYERLLAEAKDLDSALEMELVADEPPPGALGEGAAPEWPGPGAGAKLPSGAEWPGPGEGARLPSGAEWPGPGEGARLPSGAEWPGPGAGARLPEWPDPGAGAKPPVLPEWPGPGAGARLPAMAAESAPAPATPAPTGVAELPPATTSADWSSVRAVLESAIAEQGDAGLAVATYSPGDLSEPVSVVTFSERASGQSVKPIDLGALPPGHTLPPAPKPRSERSIWAVKGMTKEVPLEQSGPTPVPPSVTIMGPGRVAPERVEAWPVMERVAAPELEPPVDSGAVVFREPGAAPAAPAAPPPGGARLPEPPGVSLRAPGGPRLPEPPGVSLRAPGGARLPEPPGVSLRAPAPAHPAAHPPVAPPPPAAPPPRAAALPAAQSVSLRPTAPPAAPARAAAAAPPARPPVPASDGHSVSMHSRPAPARGEPAAPSSQQVVALRPPAAQQRTPTPPRVAPRQYVSIASADGVVMARSPVLVGGASTGAARAGTRAPASSAAVPRQSSAPGAPVAPPRPPGVSAARPVVPMPSPPTRSVVPPPRAPAAPAGAAPAAPPAHGAAPAAPPADADSIFGGSPQSEKSLHEIILSYLSGEDKTK